jgi:predicted MFS family arabinose efflux permease
MRLSLIVALSLSQIIGWGTTFYMPAVLAEPLAAAVGVDRAAIFLGPTLMVTLAALVAPKVGALLDRLGAAPPMAVGSLLLALGFIPLALSPSRVTFVLAWICFGFATPLCLSLAATTLVTQRSTDAKRGISILLLFTGLSVTLFWPLTAALQQAIGWQGTLLTFAALNAGVAFPLHLLQIRDGSAGARRKPSPTTMHGESLPLIGADAPQRRAAFWLLVFAFSCQGFVSWGLPLHLISMFESMGLASSVAVAVAALNGPATIGARLLEMMFASRLKTFATAFIAMTLLPLSFLALLTTGAPATAAIAFVILWCGANGVMSIVRNTLPLVLFGRHGYGTTMGKLTLPQNLVFATAPALFALVLQSAGMLGAITMAVAASVVSLLSLAGLAWILRPREHLARHLDH